MSPPTLARPVGQETGSIRIPARKEGQRGRWNAGERGGDCGEGGSAQPRSFVNDDVLRAERRVEDRAFEIGVEAQMAIERVPARANGPERDANALSLEDGRNDR